MKSTFSFFRLPLLHGMLAVATMALATHDARAEMAVFEDMGLDAGQIESLTVIESACTIAADVICAGTVKSLSGDTPGTTAAVLEAACDAGRLESCGALAYLYSKSFEVPTDDEKSVALYTRACDGGFLPACAGLGYMTSAGRGIEEDAAAAFALYEENCAADDGLSCTNLGYAYSIGMAGNKDPEKALAMAEKACELDNPLGCTNAGFNHYNRGDLRTAIDLIDKGCELGRSAACHFFAVAYYNGDPFRRDYETAAYYANRACKTDDPWSCHVKAQAVDKMPIDMDPRFVRGLYLHACDLGREEACEGDDRHGLSGRYRWDDAEIVFAPTEGEPVSLGNAYEVEDVTLMHADNVLIIGNTPYFQDKPFENYNPANSGSAQKGKLVWGDFGAYFADMPLEGVSPETFDPASFEPLDFPFSKDATRAWSGDDLIKGVDIATFETLASQQAKDATTYYFREANQADVPYTESVTVYPDCFGWATIDGMMHYRGLPRDEVDAQSYRCIDFILSADKTGLYSYGSLKVRFEGKLDPEAMRFIEGKFVTDGETLLWIGGGPAFEIEGLDLATLESVNGQELTDGTNSVFCDGRVGDPCRMR